MFGIDNEIVSDIARMPGSHSWAVFYMKGGHEVERAIGKWIDKITENHIVSSILKEVLFLYLEHRAVIEYKKQKGLEDTLFDESISVIDNAHDAVTYGVSHSYLKYPLAEDLEQAETLMTKMFKGQILPFGKVPIPLPPGYENINPYRNPFCPVGIRPLFWGNCDNNDFDRYTPTRFFGIVDLETGYTFSTVTSRYCLYTNEEVYNLLVDVACGVFEDEKKSSTIDDFELSNKSGVCKMTVKRTVEEYLPMINDGWQAMLEGINSYDKSEPLRYTFGYQNKKYRIPLLMPEYTVSIETQHKIPFADFRDIVLDKVRKNIVFSALQKSIRDIIQELINTKLADRDMMPLFCKYFGISAFPSTKNGEERLIQKLEIVESLIKRSVTDFGRNAYSMLNVILEYISTNDRYSYHNDWELGKWVHEFLEASKKDGFSISKYIGNDCYDIVSWYECNKK